MNLSFVRTIVQHSWPLLTLPLILYGGTVLPYLFDPTTTWIIRAWLPGCVTLTAFIGYQRQWVGARTAFVLGTLIALGVGSLITWTVSRQLILPYLPRHPQHIFWSLHHIDWVNVGHGFGSLSVSLLLLIVVMRESLQNPRSQTKTTHGSACLATRAEIKHMTVKDGLPLGLLSASYNPFEPLKTAKAIKARQTGQLLFAKPAHTMVIAPSGAGKGVGYVMPTLLEYPGSVFVTDIKGENYAVTARYRRSLGRRVVVMDPYAITKDPTVCFNVLDLIRTQPEHVIDDATRLAKLLCPTNAYEPDNTKYFTDHAAQLLECLLLYVKLTATYSDDQRHLGIVYDSLSLGDKALKGFLENLSSHHELACGTVARLSSIYKDTPEREFSGITNTARQQLSFLNSQGVRTMLTTTTFDVQQIVQGQADFYLCIPFEEIDSQARLIRLMASLIVVLMTQARGQRGAHPLLMIVDEMPALGYVPQFEKVLTLGRGFGLTFMGISQSIDILQSVYPKTWRTFLSANTAIFIDAAELQTADYVSQKLGRRTISQQSTSKGSSHQQKTGERQTSQQAGTSVSETGRSLLTADEVARLGPEISLVFLRGEPPLMLGKPVYYQHKRWQGRFDSNPLERT